MPRAHSAALVSTEANPRDEAEVSLFDRQSYCLDGSGDNLTGLPIWLYSGQNAVRGRPGARGDEVLQIAAGLPPRRSAGRPRTALAARADPGKQESDQTSSRLEPAAVSSPGRGSEGFL